METGAEIKFQRYILLLFYHTSALHKLFMKTNEEIKISLSWVSSPLISKLRGKIYYTCVKK